MFPKKLVPLAKKKLYQVRKLHKNEEFEKGNIFLNDMKEPVYTIHRKYLENFQG